MNPDAILAGVLWNELWFSGYECCYPDLLAPVEPRLCRRPLDRHSALYTWPGSLVTQ